MRALGAVVGDPQVDAALERDSQTVRDGLSECIVAAQAEQTVRTDRSAGDLATWLMVLLDGFASQVASSPTFAAERERVALQDAAARLLAP